MSSETVNRAAQMHARADLMRRTENSEVMFRSYVKNISKRLAAWHINTATGSPSIIDHYCVF